MTDRTNNRMSIVVLPEVKLYFEKTSADYIKTWIRMNKQGRKPTPSFLASDVLTKYVRNSRRLFK